MPSRQPAGCRRYQGCQQRHPYSMDNIRNVVVMGSGCAGHTAALYSARANLKPLVLEGHEPGGQLSLTTLVENFPGFPHGIQGPELIENMRKQAARFGAEYRMGHVVKADLNKHPFELSVGKETIQTRTLIVAKIGRASCRERV